MKEIYSSEVLLRELVSIPSVSPEGTPGTDQTGEIRVAEHLAVRLRAAGAHVSMQEARPGRPNLTASFMPTGPVRRRIAFAPHLDTVSVEGMTIDPFSARKHDGRIYGRGACDTKGPAAAALSVLLTLAATGELTSGNTEWIFLGLAGEEDGSFGAQELCRSGFHADLVIALEPTDCKVVCAHKGALWLKLKTVGTAAHGSAPQRGDNAVYKMARAVAALEELSGRFIGKKHPLLGGATLNVGRITGGSRINIVPDACELLVDIRTHSDFTGVQALKSVHAAVGPDVAVEVLRDACPLEADQADPLVKVLIDQSEGVASADWFSDASVFAEYGIPSVVFGPGSIAQAHTKDEWIALDALNAGTESLMRFVRQIN